MSPELIPVFVECIKKHALNTVRVPHQEQLVVLPGECPQHCFHDRVCNAAGFIHHYQHMVLMEPLHVLRFCCCLCRGKPPLGIPVHVNFCFRPCKKILHFGRSKPLCDLRPEHVIELLHSRGRGYHLGIRPAYEEPDDEPRFQCRFTNTLAGLYCHFEMAYNIRSNLPLPAITVHIEHIFKKSRRVIIIDP